MTMTAEKILGRIVQARSNLILDDPFFGVLSLRLDLLSDPTCKTFWTDGRSIGYNPDFATSLTLPEIEAVFCHEVLHVANGHPWRRGDRDKEKWNVACDEAINPIIVEAGKTLPAGVLLSPQYRGMSAEEVYGLLPEDSGKDDKSQDQGQDSQGQSSQGQGQGQDESQDESQGQGQDESQGQDEQSQPSCGEVRDAPADDAEALEAEWQVATFQAAQAAKSQGKLPASLEKIVEELRKPKIDWKAALRRFVQQALRDDYSWRTPDPRYVPAGLYLPAVRSEQMPAIAVGIDASGSVWDKQEEFAAELTAVMDEVSPELLVVIYFDAVVQHVEEFQRGETVTFTSRGGGGTDFRPVFEHIDRENVEPACMIILTDLYGTFPESEPEYPVLWVATTDIQPPFGETIRLEEARR